MLVTIKNERRVTWSHACAGKQCVHATQVATAYDEESSYEQPQVFA